MTGQRRFWTAFAAAVVAVLSAMAWMTVHLLELEDAERASSAQSDHMDQVRLALWRMDSWLNAQLAPEAARPHFQYDAYYAQREAYTRVLGAIEPGEVLTPSPLLTFSSELFPLHFQVGSETGLTSPQLPQGNLRDLAQANLRSAQDLTGRESLLAGMAPYLSIDDLATRVGHAEQQPRNCAVFPPAGVEVSAPAQRDFQTRAATSNFAKNAEPQQQSWVELGRSETATGPLLPLWLGDPSNGTANLVFARRVTSPARTLYQGFLVDWPRLQSELLARVADLFPSDRIAKLVRRDEPTPEQEGRTLAAIPALLEVPMPQVEPPSWTPTRTVLSAAWGAVLLAIVAAGLTLGSALSFGSRRARFASAVTHELRSPLTTFRMYSEMLAEGMVTDPDKRAEYLTTLHRESDRLSRLVENVLTYARIEEGRHRGRRETMALGELMERVREPLERRTQEAGFALRVAVTETDASVTVDADALAQVLFGLVDNACKYAADGERLIEVSAARAADDLEFCVRDHGTGIPAAHQRAVFRPFERGARTAGESVIPGVGLGLALARGLARELGGDLVLDPSIADGACFRLRIPIAT